MSTKAEGKNSILLKSALQNHPYPMLGLWKVKAKDNDGKICFPTLALPNHILSYAKIAKIYQYNKQQQFPSIILSSSPSQQFNQIQYSFHTFGCILASQTKNYTVYIKNTSKNLQIQKKSLPLHSL